MTVVLIVFLALVIDRFVGEPDILWRRWPHPAQLMGQGVGWLDQRLNSGGFLFLKGVFTVSVLSIAALTLGWIIASVPDFGLLEVLLGAVLLAHKSLCDHVLAVADGLDQGVAEGQRQVALIVSRDTTSMNEVAVARSAIESVAENFSDAVVAPVFWFCLLGLPGLLFYKTVNTADSMIGYRNEKYRQFGWAAARLDDVLNFIPARLTAVLVCLVHRSSNAWQVVRNDAGLHRSPNAGWPEAAVAGVLNIALAGPRSYDGHLKSFPFVNANGRHELAAGDIRNAVGVINRSWIGLAGILFVLVPIA